MPSPLDRNRFSLLPLFVPAALCLSAASASAANCVVDHDKLAAALKASVEPAGGPTNGGFDNNEWAAVVARDGTVCAVARSGNTVGEQWPASRAIAMEKANTANAMSLPDFALSTANLYAGSQPGGFLYGAAASNPPDTDVIYAGPAAKWGTVDDPAGGKTTGGVIVFGGGLPLYDASGLIGGLGASGDTSCADHNIAWRIRHNLGLDRVPGGLAGDAKDAIIYDVGTDGKSDSGYGHPDCGGTAKEIALKIGAGVESIRPPLADTNQPTLPAGPQPDRQEPPEPIQQ